MRKQFGVTHRSNTSEIMASYQFLCADLVKRIDVFTVQLTSYETRLKELDSVFKTLVAHATQEREPQEPENK